MAIGTGRLIAYGVIALAIAGGVTVVAGKIYHLGWSDRDAAHRAAVTALNAKLKESNDALALEREKNRREREDATREAQEGTYEPCIPEEEYRVRLNRIVK